MVKNIKDYFGRFFLIGKLVDCRLDDHKKALQELFLTLFFSFCPIFVAILVDFLITLNKGFILKTSIYNNIKNGELFLYATSLIAPMFYLVLKERGGAERRFPHTLAHMFVFYVLWAVTFVCFAVQRSVPNINQMALFEMSVFVFVISIVLYYLVLVYSNALMPGVTDVMREQEEEFNDEVKKHRGTP